MYSKSKLPSTHHHHHRRRRRCDHGRLLLQLLLEVIVVARFIFKRRNPGAAEDGSVEVFIAARGISHACPWVTRE